MPWIQRTIELAALPRGFHLITREVLAALPELAGSTVGLLHVFIQHTSASLTINENADPDVPADLESSVRRDRARGLSPSPHVRRAGRHAGPCEGLAAGQRTHQFRSQDGRLLWEPGRESISANTAAMAVVADWYLPCGASERRRLSRAIEVREADADLRPRQRDRGVIRAPRIIKRHRLRHRIVTHHRVGVAANDVARRRR